MELNSKSRWGISKFFVDGLILNVNIPNEQELDFGKLCAGLRSASYVPNEGNEFEKLKKRAREVFL